MHHSLFSDKHDERDVPATGGTETTMALEGHQRGNPPQLVEAAFFGDRGPNGETLEQVFGEEGFERLGKITCLYPKVVTSGNFKSCIPDLRNLRVIFATWGMLPLTESQLKHLPRLEALFYAAGMVRHFARPFLKRGILVTSSAAANAVPVAEFTVAQILLANKGYFRNLREYRETGNYFGSFCGEGNYQTAISLLGAGQIGRRVVELLRPYQFRIMVFDPFLSDVDANKLGVKKVALREAFERGYVVSNHLADLDETAGMLDRPLFQSMRRNATFINTGRGRTVEATGMAAVFGEREDLTALLDVTDPDEPLPAESPLWSLPNVHISSHIAGSKGREVRRLADRAIEEFERWSRGMPVLYAVTEESLDRGA